MKPIQVYFPTLRAVAISRFNHELMGVASRRGKPLPYDESNPTLEGNVLNVSSLAGDIPSLAELQGRLWLTSLGLEIKGLQMELKECIMSINQTKNIITTPLVGRDGTVKEYISLGDYQLSLKIGIGSEQGELNYPLQELKTLEKILNHPENIALHSELLQVFNIQSGVVKSYQFTQETHTNRQSLSVEMLSDLPYEVLGAHPI